MKKEKSLDIAATNNGVKKETTLFFNRNGTIENIGNSPAFAKASFSLSKDQIIFSELIETEIGYCIIGFN